MDQMQQPRQHTQIVYQSSQPKILVSSSTNFTRAVDQSEMQYYQERPMMLNAWTQTASEDFEYLRPEKNNQQKSQQNQTERMLLEKIRILEENLRAHSDILSQIHVTSGRKSSLQPSQSSPGSRLTSPNTTTSTSVINQAQPAHTESVKYTIIAEGNDNENGEPIEIQLAEDDGAINLNSSADSGRLEICLADDNAEIKNEILKTETCTPSPSYIKRRKVESETPETTQNSNYFFDDQGHLTPTNINGNGNPSINTTRRKSNTTPRGNNGIKVAKLEPMSMETPPRPISQKMDMDNVMVSIGPNNTRIPAKVYENMSWASASIATRKLLMAIFDRKTLATHSMTGKPSPAFKDHGKPLKQMLDPLIIQDVLFVVTRKCNVSEKEVRNAITTKCADENKMMKLQMNKSRMLKEVNKENVSYTAEK